VETERLILRQPRLGDAGELAVAHRDPETVRYIGDGRRSVRVAEKIGERYEREIVMCRLPALLYALETA
jgi:RimJ/RimL family protein N-acetyltransferase